MDLAFPLPAGLALAFTLALALAFGSASTEPSPGAFGSKGTFGSAFGAAFASGKGKASVALAETMAEQPAGFFIEGTSVEISNLFLEQKVTQVV